MNKYELLLVFKPTFEGDNLEQALQPVETVLKNNKAKVLRTDKIGRKKMAYAMQKSRDGLVACLALEAEPASVTAITHNLNLMKENILRYSILRNDDLDATKAFVVTPVTGHEPREPRGGRKPMGAGGPRGAAPGAGRFARGGAFGVAQAQENAEDMAQQAESEATA
jgi:small subunit ribosomal protein S6